MSQPAPPSAMPAGGPFESRPERALQVEDVVLALWLGAIEYGIRSYTGDDILPLIESLDLRIMELTWDTPWAWVAQPGLVMGGLLAIALVPLSIVLFRRNLLLPGVRRSLIVPAALIGTSLCRDVSLAVVREDFYRAPVVATLHAGLSILPFLLLVAAPRVLVGASSDWRRWLARFTLFYAAWWAGALAGR